jgi:hypothetical protein
MVLVEVAQIRYPHDVVQNKIKIHLHQEEAVVEKEMPELLKKNLPQNQRIVHRSSPPENLSFCPQGNLSLPHPDQEQWESALSLCADVLGSS